MSKKQNWVIIILFLIMIFGITGGTLLKKDIEFSEKENRDLAQSPDVSMDSIFDGSFAADYETYLSDQFMLRNAWIGLKTQVERATFRQEINGIYFAEDGYLIEKHQGSFQTDTAKRNITALSQFMEQCLSQYGAGHVKAMVVPNAVQVLKDKLPPFAYTSEEEDYLESLRGAMPSGTLVDVEGVLNAHREEELYYKTDHHWKTLGAFYAYQAWAMDAGFAPPSIEDYTIETLASDFLGTIESKVNSEVKSDSIEAFHSKNPVKYTLTYNRSDDIRTDLYDRSYLGTKDKYAVFFGGNQPVIEAATDNGSGRRLLVIKDSYAHCFVPFTFEYFSEVDMVDLRYFNESLKSFMRGKVYTDILFLYNASGFAEDPSVMKLGN